MSSRKVNEKIAAILGLPGNSACADCSTPITKDTGWASLNLGVVLCINCGGVHRSMGTHVSKVRSFRLDTNAWTDQVVELFTQIGGNDKANSDVWEANLPFFWMTPRTDRQIDELRDFYIRSKYEKKQFLPVGYDPNRYNPAIIKLPTEIFQGALEFRPPGARKWTKPEWGIIHTRWFSRYHSPKDRTATQFLNLKDVQVKTGLSELDDRFEFSLHTATNTDDEKAAEGELILEARCDNFTTFVKWVHHLRITSGFFKCYDELYKTPDFPPPLNLSPFDIQADTTRILGYAKSGGVVKKSKWYCAVNGYLYVYRENVASKVTNLPQASNAMDLQLIDAVVDVEGERSGAKFAVIIIEGEKTHVLKFDSGPEAVKFYSGFKSSWRETRGRFTTDFSGYPPVITGENSRDRAASFSPRGFQGLNFDGPPVPPPEPEAEATNILTLIDELKARLPEAVVAIDDVKSPEEALAAWNRTQYSSDAPQPGAATTMPVAQPPPGAALAQPGAAPSGYPQVPGQYQYQAQPGADGPGAAPPAVPESYSVYASGGLDDMYDQQVDIYADDYQIGVATAKGPQDRALPVAPTAAKRESLIPSYIRFIRYFQLTPEQHQSLSDPGVQSQILSYIGDQATILAQANTLKITIHSGIPLPRREDLWNHIIDSVVQIIGGINEIKQ